jgi:transcriptional regulator with XRE-family HTH domain
MEQAAIERRIATLLAGMRAARGLTLDDLAARAGVSRAMISRIERCEANPTAALLGRLANALGVTLSAFFADVEAAGPLARRADRSVWRDPATGYTRSDVAPPAASTNIVEVILPAGVSVDYANDVPFDVEQLVWLIEGDLRLTVGGEAYRLVAGDCLMMRLDRPVRYENTGSSVARYAVVLPARSIGLGRAT